MMDEAGNAYAESIRSVTTDDFRDFISDIKIDPSCRECGNEETRIAVHRTGKMPGIPAFNIPPDFDDAVVNYLFQLICPRCGHTRLFDAKMTAEWKKGRVK